MNRFGITQGRLTLPKNDELQCFPDDWENEFEVAQNLGLGFIELLAERSFNSSNPIWSNSGREKIISKAQKNNLLVYSSCTDYIISNSILLDETIAEIKLFIDASSKVGCKLVILPLFGESHISFENFKELIKTLQHIGRYCIDKNIVIGIESPCTPDEIIYLLKSVQLKNVRCVFDTGNRALISENVANEIRQLSDWICHAHIKDKDHNDQNVVLGTGLINFKQIFDAFADIGYKGPFVFETVRGRDPIMTAKYNINFCEYFTFNAN